MTEVWKIGRSRERLLQYAAERRFALETAGIMVDGFPVRTDRESQGLINAAYSLARADPDELVDFKTPVGWVRINSRAMLALGLAVGRHIRACFRAERVVAEKIEDGTYTTIAQIDQAYTAALQ